MSGGNFLESIAGVLNTQLYVSRVTLSQTVGTDISTPFGWILSRRLMRKWYGYYLKMNNKKVPNQMSGDDKCISHETPNIYHYATNTVHFVGRFRYCRFVKW